MRKKPTEPDETSGPDGDQHGTGLSRTHEVLDKLTDRVTAGSKLIPDESGRDGSHVDQFTVQTSARVRGLLDAARLPVAPLGGEPTAGPPRWLDLGGRRSVLLLGDIVAKLHPVVDAPDAPHAADLARLTARLTTAARLPHLFLPPLLPSPLVDELGPVTVWPRATPPHWPDPDSVPWPELGIRLARLHRTDPAPGLPPAATLRRVERIRAELGGLPSEDGALLARLLDDALTELRATTGPTTLVHGDWHLGQLVRHDDDLVLVDIDDLGLGHPAWDLGRTAGGFAAGFLDAAHWDGFLAGYRGAHGPALHGPDPWRVIDAAARAAVVVMTARLLLPTGLATPAEGAEDGDQPDTGLCQNLLDTCRRMARCRNVE